MKYKPIFQNDPLLAKQKQNKRLYSLWKMFRRMEKRYKRNTNLTKRLSKSPSRLD